MASSSIKARRRLAIELLESGLDLAEAIHLAILAGSRPERGRLEEVHSVDSTTEPTDESAGSSLVYIDHAYRIYP